MSTMRSRVAKALDINLAIKPGLSWVNWLIVVMIGLSAFVVVLETEVTIFEPNRNLFFFIEMFFLAFFVIEYGLRVWVSVENERNKTRLHYIVRPVALIDLFVILTMAFTLIGIEGALLRLMRLFRLMRVMKLGKYSSALVNIGNAISARRFELIVSLSVAFVLLLVSAAALYLLEGEVQPEAFGSIPRAMWWAMATLTTVGYGDVVPVTLGGRFFAMLTAVTGVGLIAMPAGILASAFSEAIQKRNAAREAQDGAEVSG
jgi:voltage-gated potassium channel